jgi:hypothetical protein
MSASEALFWYNTSIGRNYSYYYDLNSTYTPVFASTPTEEQKKEAAQYCTMPDGGVDASCTYDYLQTGNKLAAAATLTSSSQKTDTLITLCME